MSDFGRNHRNSPLSWQRPRRPGRGPRAGDRVQDVSVVPVATATAGGPAVRLHRLLGYDRWTLLLAAARADAATLRGLRQSCEHTRAPVEILPVVAADRDATRHLGRVDEFKLIRPDGHIGLVAPLNRIDVLHSYLAEFL
jgi:hypothetical protein